MEGIPNETRDIIIPFIPWPMLDPVNVEDLLWDWPY
jgi:hypothetical protein